MLPCLITFICVSGTGIIWKSFFFPPPFIFLSEKKQQPITLTGIYRSIGWERERFIPFNNHLRFVNEEAAEAPPPPSPPPGEQRRQTTPGARWAPVTLQSRLEQQLLQQVGAWRGNSQQLTSALLFFLFLSSSPLAFRTPPTPMHTVKHLKVFWEKMPVEI